jgi:hypothetical protein
VHQVGYLFHIMFKMHGHINLKNNLKVLIIRRVNKIGGKPAISFIISVCLSVRVKQLGSHWTDFHKTWYLIILRKSVGKIQVSLKSDKNKG